jgi:hypothetical protein
LIEVKRQTEKEALTEIAEAEDKAKQRQRELHRTPVGQNKQISRPRTIAITGTMEADKSRVKRRIETLLHPYLDENTIWYCGGRGTTDELVLEYQAGSRPRGLGPSKSV